MNNPVRREYALLDERIYLEPEEAIVMEALGRFIKPPKVDPESYGVLCVLIDGKWEPC